LQLESKGLLKEDHQVNRAIDALGGSIIISCQVMPEDPTYGPSFMAAFAQTAKPPQDLPNWETWQGL